jgi:hypothetical protein
MLRTLSPPNELMVIFWVLTSSTGVSSTSGLLQAKTASIATNAKNNFFIVIILVK